MPRLAAAVVPCVILLAPVPRPDVASHVLADMRASSVAPRLILLDGGHLAAVRTRIHKGDERLRTAVGALEEDGRKAMTLTPVSVMDKGVTPPSGDKRDYMSQAPYWCADPRRVRPNWCVSGFSIPRRG